MLRLIITSVVGGLIALSTNWVAIRMLLRPHRAVRIFGFRLPFTPGLIPKERERIANRLANAIATRLMDPQTIASYLTRSGMFLPPNLTLRDVLALAGIDDVKNLRHLLSGSADAWLPRIIATAKGILAQNPQIEDDLRGFVYTLIDKNTSTLTSLFMNKDKLYKKFRQGFCDYFDDEKNLDAMRGHLERVFDMGIGLADAQINTLLDTNLRDFAKGLAHGRTFERITETLAAYFANNMRIQQMIEEKMAAISVEEIEEILLSVAGRELKMIVLFGGVLGFFIGLFAALF